MILTTAKEEMSHVTTVIIISPCSRFPDEVNEFLTKRHHGDYYEEGERFPVLESTYGNEGSLFGGGKFPSGSMVWIGWNYCYIEDLIEELQQFQDLTVWYETEGELAGVHKINWTYPRL
jgi:hypothetical protein